MDKKRAVPAVCGCISDNGATFEVAQTSTNQGFHVPPRTAGLLYIVEKYGDPKSNARMGFPIGSPEDDELWCNYEPSTIFLSDAVVFREDVEFVDDPDYYPTYHTLTPEQRGVYLKWLQDPTAEVDYGYVFLYYYGLERQLLLGNFQDAVDEILMLRDCHNKPSFLLSSMNALLTACVIKNRPDTAATLLNLFKTDAPSDIELVVAARMDIELPIETVMGLARDTRESLQRYLKLRPDYYRQSLADFLKTRTGRPTLPLEWLPSVDSLPKRQQEAFVNFSFPNFVGHPDIPSILSCPEFTEFFDSMCATVHESVKARLALERQSH